MKIKVLSLFLSLLAVFAILPAAHAQSRWQGTSTNMSRNFNYGKVTFTVKNGFVRDFKIEGVTTSGCGGYKNVIVPRIKIRQNKFKTTYQPIPGINDFVKVNGKFSGTKATGTFSEGPLCSNAGLFSAKRK